MSWLRAAPPLVLLAVAAAWGAGLPLPSLAGGGRALRPGAEVDARVLRAVDGDTVEVVLGARRETVRYIGVDTPETVKPHTRVECFGPAASRANHGWVDGQAVRLALQAEPRDRYGRLLADVHRARDGLWVNAALLRGGYATTLTIAPNDEHAAVLRRLERRARAGRRGLWGHCGEPR